MVWGIWKCCETISPVKLHAGLGAVDELCGGEVVGQLTKVLHPAVVALYIPWGEIYWYFFITWVEIKWLFKHICLQSNV